MAKEGFVPRISIVIPCLGDTLQFESTLASVLQNRPSDCEVLVSHNLPYPDPYDLAREVCFVHASQAVTHSDLLNAAFEATRSAVVHVVQCGLEVSEGWVEPALTHFEDPHVGMVSPVIGEGNGLTRVQAAGWDFTPAGRCVLVGSGERLANLQNRQTPKLLAPTLAAGYYRRSLWRLLRWDSKLSDVLAPVALGLSAKLCGWHTECEPQSILHGNTPTIPRNDAPFDYRASLTAERLFWRANAEHRGLGIKLLHALQVALEAVAALPSPRAVTGLFGRCWGYATRREAAVYRTQLEIIAEQVQASFTADEHSPMTIPYATPGGANRSNALPAAVPGKQRAA
jgi:hypothetical protein